jgi:hypothetical protein
MAHDIVGCTLAAFQRAHRKAVAEIVYPRLGRTRVLLQLKGPDQIMESPIDHGITKWLACVREEDMVIITRTGIAPLKVAFQDAVGAGM